MAEMRHMVMGLQSSGKTTFAAALWHLVDSREIETSLTKGSHTGDFRYLEEISAAWAAGWQIGRTFSDQWEPVRMNLLHPESSSEIQLNFIDLSGETFEKIFATRNIEERVETLLREMSGLLLFVTALRPRDDVSIVDIGQKLPEAMPEETDDDAPAVIQENAVEQPFTASLSPHQVQLVDLLDSLVDQPVSMRPARIAVIISAWDKAPNISPERWLHERMPLLHQYLSTHQDEIPFRIYGVSAQGGSVPTKEKPDEKSDRAELLKKPIAGERIKVVGNGASEHDLTHPIRWLGGLEP